MATLTGTDFTNANLKGATITKDTNFEGAKVEDTKFSFNSKNGINNTRRRKYLERRGANFSK